METLSLFALEGLGNSVNNLPIIFALKDHYSIHLYMMDNGSASFYQDLNLGINVIPIKSKYDVLMKSFRKCDIACSLYPNGIKECLCLLRCKSTRKYSFYDRSIKRTFIPFTQKVFTEEIHDIDNNIKLLSLLPIPFVYPALPSLFTVAKTNSITVHPTASTLAKFYSVSFWITLLDNLIDSGATIEMFCGNGEMELSFCKSIISSLRHSNAINLYSGLHIFGVAQRIARSSMFIGLDSALMHIAALCDVFTIGLWSFSDYKRIFPYGINAHVYISKEAVAKSHRSYPRKMLPWINRAKSDDVIQIANSTRISDYSIETRFKNPTQFYIF